MYLKNGESQINTQIASTKDSAQANYHRNNGARNIRVLTRPFDPIFFAGLFLYQLIAYTINDYGVARIVNITSSVLVTCFLLATVARIARRDPLGLWTPLFWFRVAGAAYIGYGSLAPNLVNSQTLFEIMSVNFFNPTQHLQVNMIYSLGMASTLLFSEFFLRFRIGNHRQYVQNLKFFDVQSQAQLRKYAVIFLLAGGFFRYGFAMPVAFGLPNIVPGMVLALAQIYYVGIVFLVMYSVGRPGKWTMVAIALIAVDLALSLLTFSKQQVLLLLLLSTLSYFTIRFSLTRIIFALIVAIFTFNFLQGFIQFGRAELPYISGNALVGTMSERAEVVQRFFDGGRYEGNRPEIQSSIMRLSYVNADAFVVNEYNNNMPGHTYEHLLAVFVPRVFWPNKPIITLVGVELYYMMTSQVGSSFGTTIWAESYWNFGWLGVPLMSIPLALVLSVMSLYSLSILRNGQWLFFPIVIIGMNIGIRLDGFFVADVLGQAWIAIVLATFLKILQWFTLKR